LKVPFLSLFHLAKRLSALISKKILSAMLFCADEDSSVANSVEEATAIEGYAVTTANNVMMKYRKIFVFMVHSTFFGLLFLNEGAGKIKRACKTSGP